MATPPAERKALLFSAGGVRLALRLSQVREIAPAEPGAGEARLRGGTVPLLPVAVTLGLQPGPGAFALVIEATSPLAFRADALHGIVDLAEAEVFRLPARTALPDPSPYLGAVLTAARWPSSSTSSVLGWAPLRPPRRCSSLAAGPVPPSRSLRFAQAGRVYAAPLSLLVQVLEAARPWPVPLAPRPTGAALTTGALHRYSTWQARGRSGAARQVLPSTPRPRWRTPGECWGQETRSEGEK
jgi:chemotaxis signal transduction protein